MADLIFSGGRVWTGVPGRPLAEALAVRHGRIVGVGRDDEVLPLAESGTVLVRLEGRTLLPGFVDAHLHLVAGGYSLSQVGLGEVESRAGLARCLESWAARLPEGQWITGGGWDHERWGGALPAREWIDPVTPDHPVLVHRLDLHMALANSRALEHAGIDASTPDPPGGLLVRDGEGRPTGLLKDRAIDLVADRIPRADAEAREAAIRAAGRHLLSRGVTQAHDMGTLGDSEESWHNLASYRSLRERDCLRLRVYAFVPLAHRARLADYVAEHGRGDAWLRWGAVKGFLDGSLGSGTAWMNEGFTDEPENRGLTLTDPDELRRGVEEADAAGLHVAVHAIGDRANDVLLDAFQGAVRANGPRDRRFRVEHAQHLSAAAVARFGEEGVVASVQPYHLADDGRWAERRLGPERTRRSWPLASLEAAGARLAFGSDWTVAPPDPVRTLAAAVTRRTLDGGHPEGWTPEERIPLEAALRAHTGQAAWAGFMDGWTGRLVPGASADLVVLDRDLFALPAKEWAEACVEETVVEGRVEYRRGDEPQEEGGTA